MMTYMNTHELSVIILGDVFGKVGRRVITSQISSLKKKYKPDITIANIENMTHGSGFSPSTVEELHDAGVDFFTGGDHSLDNKNGISVLKMENSPVIRPANFPSGAPGNGYLLIETNKGTIALVNLVGRLFMRRDFMHKGFVNPFRTFNDIYDSLKTTPLAGMIVDFHAETTSEKKAFAYHANGRASVVYGTHTHVQTADEHILDNGTGFITDVGFNGPHNSVIGIDQKNVVYNFLHSEQKKTSIVEKDEGVLNGIHVLINTKTGRCTSITRINSIIKTL